MATDEHDEDGVLISDEFTNPHKRQAMHEKRMRKMEAMLPLLEPPALFGQPEARSHAGRLGLDGRRHSRSHGEASRTNSIIANNLQIKWLVPLHAEAITAIVSKCKKRDHRREQLQRPVRALSALRDQLRRRRPHSQVRWRAVHAAPHRRRRQEDSGGHN